MVLTALVTLATPVLVSSQGMPLAEPFKVGTSEIDGRAQVRIVLRDRLIVDLDAASLSLERDPV